MTESEKTEQGNSYNLGLTPIHLSQKSVTRVHMIILSVIVLIQVSILNLVLAENFAITFGTIVGPVAVPLIALILFLPDRKCRRWGYDMGEEHLRVLRGNLFRTDTIVPFNRVQHIDVTQGPIERYFGVSKLVVHTAGTHNSTVSLIGLDPQVAEDMRETIKAHIRQDMV